jgi:hypothetical protein
VTTVEDVVEAMEARYGLAGRRYLVGTPKSELKK